MVGRARANDLLTLFVTDAGLAAAAQSFEWTVTESAGPPVTQTTSQGEFSYIPRLGGELNLAVRILGEEIRGITQRTLGEGPRHLLYSSAP